MIYLLSYYLLLNIIGFVLMGIDKKRAIKREWRIKESSLWWIAISGGAIGGFVGMRIYRHKTKHTTFTILFPTFALFHIVLLIYLYNLIA